MRTDDEDPLWDYNCPPFRKSRSRAWRVALALWLLAGLAATIAALMLARLLGAL